jgi:uncharacterized protein (DUF2235 family)
MAKKQYSEYYNQRYVILPNTTYPEKFWNHRITVIGPGEEINDFRCKLDKPVHGWHLKDEFEANLDNLEEQWIKEEIYDSPLYNAMQEDANDSQENSDSQEESPKQKRRWGKVAN